MGAVSSALPRDAGDGLVTARLKLRRFAAADLPWLAALYADPHVAGPIGGTKTEDQCREMLEKRILAYYEEYPGLGIWLTCTHSGERVGFHLLNHIQGESLIQVGYAMLKAHWGRGYATEMCRALLRYGAAVRGLDTLLAIANPDNHASHQVLLKSGLQRKGERYFAHPAYAPGTLAYFERGAAEWLAEFAASTKRGAAS